MAAGIPYVATSPLRSDAAEKRETFVLVVQDGVHGQLLSSLGSFIVQLIAVLMIFVTLKQLSGYSKMRLLGYITLSVLIVTITLIALVTLIFYFFYVALR